MTKKKDKPEPNDAGQHNAPDDSQEHTDARDGLENIINEREKEYELQMVAQSQLTNIQNQLYDLEDQLIHLDPQDSQFATDQADILKVLIVLDDELSELKDEVGEDVLKRIDLSWSVNSHCSGLMKRINEGEFSSPSVAPAPAPTANMAMESVAEEGSSDDQVVCSSAPPPSDESLTVEEDTHAESASRSDESEERRKGGYISSISIENFKGIGDKVTIPLKPITLMFGANSAGKSTVLQALLYANEVMNNNNPDADKTEFGGDWINLGGFRSLVHNHDLSKEITIGFEYVLDDDGLPAYGFARGYEGELSDEYVRDLSGFEKLDVCYVECVVSAGNHGTPYVSQYSVDINGQTIAAVRCEPEKRPHLTWLDIQILIENSVLLAENDHDSDELYSMLFISDPDGRVAEQAHDRPERKFPGTDEEDWETSPFFESKSTDALPVWGDVISFNAVAQLVSSRIKQHSTNALLSSFVAGPGELIANALKEHRYIGPLRKSPPRFYRPQKTTDKTRWADGMAGWDALYNDVMKGDDWFQRDTFEDLGLGYEFFPYTVELSRTPFSSQVKPDEMHRTLTELFKDETAEEQFYKYLNATSAFGGMVRMRDLKNKVEMEPCDVGTGVSQVVPVIAGAMSPGCNFLSVEQPELHLHPAIQCNLGDLFISQMHRYPERTFLLETHSEHLILRLLRRIRETASGDLDEQSLALTPDDVNVLYVDELEDGVSITELPINEEGDFTRKWPKGFFDERAEELF